MDNVLLLPAIRWEDTKTYKTMQWKIIASNASKALRIVIDAVSDGIHNLANQMAEALEPIIMPMVDSLKKMLEKLLGYIRNKSVDNTDAIYNKARCQVKVPYIKSQICKPPTIDIRCRNMSFTRYRQRH